MECIILAGGLGTRLQGAIGAYPKCMAPVNNKPFLHYVFAYLEEQRCDRVILSLGYKHEVITEWLAAQQLPFETHYVTEQEPLGTGGGIQLALTKTTEEKIVILNGDTLFQVSLSELNTFHNASNSTLTIALKNMHQFSRYGTVRLDDAAHIISFEEKKYCETGWINGGVYLLDKNAFLEKHLPEKFSFEKDYLETFTGEKKFFGYKSDAYFIDIGIPEDYHKAGIDFKALF